MLHRQVLLLAAVALLAAITAASPLSQGPQPHGTIQDFASPAQGHPQEGAAPHTMRKKRAVFDQNCKGVYNRDVWKKLNRVCEHCQNLYRTSYVLEECRENCFSSEVFPECVSALLLDKLEHLQLARILQGAIRRRYNFPGDEMRTMNE